MSISKENFVKSVWYITSKHSKYEELLKGWKENMSTPNSKMILGRIQWTEETGKLPLLILGLKGDRVRYAVHGGSDDIQYASIDMFVESESIAQLGMISNDEVQAWRSGIKEVSKMQVEKVEKKAAGRPAEKQSTAGKVLSGSFNNAALKGLAQSALKNSLGF